MTKLVSIKSNFSLHFDTIIMASSSTIASSTATITQTTTTSTNTGKGLLLKADLIAQQYREEVQSSLSQSLSPPLSAEGRRRTPPKLVGILGTSSLPSKNYAEFTRKQCEELGFDFVLKKTGAALDESEGEGEGVEEAIIEANEDEGVAGIMVYYPIFGGRQVSSFYFMFSFHAVCIVDFLFFYFGFVGSLFTTSAFLDCRKRGY